MQGQIIGPANGLPKTLLGVQGSDDLDTNFASERTCVFSLETPEDMGVIVSRDSKHLLTLFLTRNDR